MATSHKEDRMIPEGWSVDPGLPDETAFLYPSEWNDVLENWPSVCGLQAETWDQYYREVAMAFKCKECKFDLSVRMDLLALAIKADYPDEDYPKELALDGTCDSCGAPFSYSGEFFTHWMKTKVEEGVISPETGKYAIIAFDVSEKEHEEFKRLTELGDKKKLNVFLKKLMRRQDRDCED